MQRVLILLGAIIVLASGCSRTPEEPAALVYSGHPVKYWITQASSKVIKERKHAIEVLGNVGTTHPDAIPTLIVALRDADAGIRDTAVLNLSKIGPPAASAIPALEALLKDTDSRVRDHARLALERIKSA